MIGVEGYFGSGYIFYVQYSSAEETYIEYLGIYPYLSATFKHSAQRHILLLILLVIFHTKYDIFIHVYSVYFLHSTKQTFVDVFSSKSMFVMIQVNNSITSQPFLNDLHKTAQYKLTIRRYYI